MIGERDLIVYEPRKILDFVEKKGGRVAAFELKELGYDYRPAVQILFWLSFDGYLEGSGRKYVRPPLEFKTEEGERKRIAGGRTQNAFELTEKGRYEKPEEGAVQTLDGIIWNLRDMSAVVSEGTPEERKQLEGTMRLLLEKGKDALIKYLKGREKTK